MTPDTLDGQDAGVAALAVLAAFLLLAWLVDGHGPGWLQIVAGALLVACCVFAPTVLGAA